MANALHSLDTFIDHHERRELYEDIRRAVDKAIDDIENTDNQSLERIEDKLAAIENRVKEIENTVSETRRLVKDEFMKISEGIALLAGIQDV